MTAAQNLVNNPVNFMNQNIVIVEMMGDTAPLFTIGVTSVTLLQRPTANVTGHMRGNPNASVDVYFLVPDPVPGWMMFGGNVADPNPFNVYFCPYQGGETHGTMISNGANLMFTTQMDGCSLGIGSTTQAGDRLIFHANRGGKSKQAIRAQEQSLRQEFRNLYTHIERIWEPKDYRISRGGTYYKATTFGVRDPLNAWSFYSQRYTTEAVYPVTTYSLKHVLNVL
jgi:hypothetical protein